ncbi:unnamed protein product [Phaedon cochleariae]|uniref:Potassium channel domain-containing protein n=1 Tax=Phaedon cochleariae TaxID=80249 RepID=A0A9P0DTM0_PHACE|nr:unnamed protein product [Phaedon cochleariae]
MMSKKQWFVLLCLFILYLLLGASIFFYIESQEEIRRSISEAKERLIIEDLLKTHYRGPNESVHYIFNRLTEYCGKPVSYNMGMEPHDFKWDFYHSLFFVITVVSTIGYGNLAPTTMFTRIFMIFYGLVGIPMNGIVMLTMGEYFGKSFKKLYKRWKNLHIEKSSAKLGLIGQIILYAVPGLTFFIFLPSTIISFFEGWNYDVSVYFAFVTLTTIGFGDYVSGFNNHRDFSPSIILCYQIFLLVWVIGGLGYLVMVIGFITQGMRSRKIVKLEKIFTRTNQKIRSEIRTILHEFLFMRVKPVYKGEFEYVPHILDRSQSCPDLTLWRNKNSPSLARKRAMSECYKYNVLERVQSDTELDKIDIERTFRPSDAFMKQKDLILKVVDALSSVSTLNREPEGGIHGFSDSEILASEQYSSPPTARPQRRRALSDIKPPPPVYLHDNTVNTWYGEDANTAFKAFNKSRVLRITPLVKKGEDKPQTFFQRFQWITNRIKKDDKEPDIEKQTADDAEKRRTSIFSTGVDIRRQSIRNEQVLEQTSIADFIRAISAIASPEDIATPKRKIGIACLTPPQYSPRMKRLGSRFVDRRTSLAPLSISRPAPRRFSLRPVEENTLSSSLAPTEAQNFVKIAETGRRFSVRPANIANMGTYVNSPVMNQVNRRKRKDSESDR